MYVTQKRLLALDMSLKLLDCCMGWGVFTKQMQKCFIYLEATFLAALIIWNTTNSKDVVKKATELPKYYQNSQVPKLWLWHISQLGAPQS